MFPSITRSLAIVGNGPSAAGQGQLIDACDDVLRINAWKTRGAPDSGTRIDIVLGFNTGVEEPPLDQYPGCEFWVQVWNPEAFSLQDPAHIFRIAHGRWIHAISKELSDACDQWVRDTYEQYGKDDVGTLPTAGYKAIVMAIREGSWSELHLFGFDAVGSTPQQMNDGYGRENPYNQVPHAVLTQKRMFAALADRGEWPDPLAPHIPRLVWHNRPEVPGYVAK